MPHMSLAPKTHTSSILLSPSKNPQCALHGAILAAMESCEQMERTRESCTIRRPQTAWPGRQNRARELSIDCIEDGVRTIYGSNFDKDVWYAGAFRGDE